MGMKCGFRKELDLLFLVGFDSLRIVVLVDGPDDDPRPQDEAGQRAAPELRLAVVEMLVKPVVVNIVAVHCALGLGNEPQTVSNDREDDNEYGVRDRRKHYVLSTLAWSRLPSCRRRSPSRRCL